MNSPPVFVVGFVAVVLAVTGLLAQQPSDRDVSCAVALDFIQEWHRTYNGKIVIGENPMNQAPTMAEMSSLLAANPVFKNDPQLPAIQRAAKIREQRPLKECANVRQWLRANNILHEDKKISLLLNGQQHLPFTVITLTMPVVEGNRAFLFAATGCGWTCGHRSYVEMKRNPRGTWVIIDEAGMGVS